MSASTLTPDSYWTFNYDVPEAEQIDAVNKLKELGYSPKKHEWTYSKWEVDDSVMSPRTLVERVKAGIYKEKSNEKKTKSSRQSEVEVPTRKRRSARTVVSSKDTVPKQSVSLRGDSDERINKRKGTRRNGSRTSKNVRRQHTAVEEVPRKKTKGVRKQRASISDSEVDNRSRKARMEARRQLRANRAKSRGAKRGTRSRR